MAANFTADEWDEINRLLDADETKYGLPARVYGSAVLGSFNIRKLGAERRRTVATWEFLGKICRRFDLLAVQEVMDDLSGLERLRAEMGDEYKMIVSDKTGAFPGSRGLNERLAFIYRTSLLRRGPIVSDITYDRTKVHELLLEDFDAITGAVAEYKARLQKHEEGKLKRAPKFKLDTFLTFIRQPYAVSFRIVGYPGSPSYEFLAVNAHLIYGEDITPRKREFIALMEWLRAREERTKNDPFPGAILMGDLNLDFDKPDQDIVEIRPYIEPFDNEEGHRVAVEFPFLRVHPNQGDVFRTNARQKDTFDHMGFFFRPNRVPASIRENRIAEDLRGPDYGVVDFVNLFANAVEGREFTSMTDDEKKEFYPRFEHSVSDHMPIWVRFPLPD